MAAAGYPLPTQQLQQQPPQQPQQGFVGTQQQQHAMMMERQVIDLFSCLEGLEHGYSAQGCRG